MCELKWNLVWRKNIFSRKKTIMQTKRRWIKYIKKEIQCENFSVKVCIVCYKCMLLLLSSLNGWCVFRSGFLARFFGAFLLLLLLLLLFLRALFLLPWSPSMKRVQTIVCVFVWESDSFFFFTPSSFAHSTSVVVVCIANALGMCIVFCDKLLIDFIAFFRDYTITEAINRDNIRIE